jgi:hypothetical protein
LKPNCDYVNITYQAGVKSEADRERLDKPRSVRGYAIDIYTLENEADGDLEGAEEKRLDKVVERLGQRARHEDDAERDQERERDEED